MSKIVKILYGVLVAVSGVIVLGYMVHEMFVTPPEVKLPVVDQPLVEENVPSDVAPELEVVVKDAYARREGCYTFLLVGADESNALADVIMVVKYDTVNQTVGMVSIPRDTLVDPAGPTRFPKINSALQYGIKTLQEVVSDMLGIPIDFYVFVDIDAFVEIIDSIGGIEFDVPIHMSYDDPVQDLHIHYEPGLQLLNGQQALEVCRLRYNDDGTLAYADYDIGRTNTQRALLVTVAEKALTHPEKLGDYIEIWNRNVETNLSITDIVWFAEQAVIGKLGAESVVGAALPGNGEVTYNGKKFCYALYPEETLSIVNEMINPYEAPLKKEELNIFQP